MVGYGAIFDDTLDTGNDTYRLDGDGVLTKANVPAQTMQHRFVEHVELNANPGNNTVVVTTVGFALDLTLRGFNGADTFDITPSDRADIRIEASDPTVPPGDVLRFSNAAAAGPAVLTPNGAVNGTYAFAFAEPVTFFGIETFPTPPAAPSQPDLSDSSDTGSSTADNVTRENSIGYTNGGITVIVPRRNFGPVVDIDGCRHEMSAADDVLQRVGVEAADPPQPDDSKPDAIHHEPLGSTT